MVQPAVVVTGASTGIGRAVVRCLSGRRSTVFAAVRSGGDARSLVDEFGPAVCPLVMDVTDEAAIRRAAATVLANLGGRTLAGVVNNAGIAVPGPLELLPLADFRRQLEVNVVGQLAVTQAFLPLMRAGSTVDGPPGRVVMVSSLSGRLADPFLGAYAASKHALEAMAASMRQELGVHGIRVVVVAPGAVRTPIWEKGAREDLSAYDQTRYATPLARFRHMLLREAEHGCSAERVAGVVVRSLWAPHPRRRYAVFSHRQMANRVLPLVPQFMYDAMCARVLGINAPR